MMRTKIGSASQRTAAKIAAILWVIAKCSATVDAAPIYFAGTDHYYDVVLDDQIPWNDGFAGAASLSYLGETGYLATITSQDEQDFLATNFGAIPDLWIGGSDAASELDWFWMAGPEAGQQFYSSQTGATAYVYPGFNGGDNVGEEDYLVWNHNGNPIGNWNDYAIGGNGVEALSGYLVEFNSAPSAVPEPASLTLVGLGAVGMAIGAYRRRKNAPSAGA